MKFYSGRLYTFYFILISFVCSQANAQLRALDFSDQSIDIPMIFFESHTPEELLQLALTFKGWKERELNTTIIENQSSSVVSIVKIDSSLPDEEKWKKLKGIEIALSKPAPNMELVRQILEKINGEVLKVHLNTGKLESFALPTNGIDPKRASEKGALYYIQVKYFFPEGIKKVYELRARTTTHRDEYLFQNLRHHPYNVTGALFVSGLSSSLGYMDLKGNLFSRFLFSMGSILKRIENSTTGDKTPKEGDLCVTYLLPSVDKVDHIPLEYLKDSHPIDVSIYVTNDLVFGLEDKDRFHRWTFRRPRPYQEGSGHYLACFRPASRWSIKKEIDLKLREINSKTGNIQAEANYKKFNDIEKEIDKEFFDKEIGEPSKDQAVLQTKNISTLLGELDGIKTYFEKVNQDDNEILTLLGLRIEAARAALNRAKMGYEELQQP